MDTRETNSLIVLFALLFRWAEKNVTEKKFWYRLMNFGTKTELRSGNFQRGSTIQNSTVNILIVIKFVIAICKINIVIKKFR